MIGREDLRWKNNILYHGEKSICALIQDKTSPHMYWIDWYVEMDDYYNLSRAKENAINFYIEKYNSSIRNKHADNPPGA